MCGKAPCDKPNCTWSEIHRRLCEARWVCALPNLEVRQAYLTQVEKARGKPATDQLRQDVKLEWEKRNGKHGSDQNTGSE
jgi:hypothetical protein